MNKYWSKIIIAAIFEVGWVIGLKHSASIFHWLMTFIAIFISFYLLITATQKLPVGTAYAVFVGLGTTGTVLMDTLLFDAPLSLAKVLFIGLLLVGVVGLKMLTDQTKEEK
ncbi:DMT family transporter [Vagococcus elongatus]|uniref:QacE family quaternary ammonium compound efflux SMR transporter n=1 Tax=Vagococcus elongatus TaxID=180344 RepID=A0A430AQA6_9ENTE|nr:SMR family transporter [Vagococcus elongatus]RSU10299.1 QacE family quaternary ammonium compound efflux SMR transporter [Vagococcus elongatus]